MKYLVFTLIVMVAINGITAAPSSKAVCSPWLGHCQVTDQCCRDLICLGYAAKCVPGKIVDDNRPIGEGPFPPKN